MDSGSVSGASMFLAAGRTQQSLSISMMKQAADQQNQVVNMLAQDARQAPQPVAQSGGNFSFSTYA